MKALLIVLAVGLLSLSGCRQGCDSSRFFRISVVTMQPSQDKVIDSLVSEVPCSCVEEKIDIYWAMLKMGMPPVLPPRNSLSLDSLNMGNSWGKNAGPLDLNEISKLSVPNTSYPQYLVEYDSSGKSSSFVYFNQSGAGSGRYFIFYNEFGQISRIVNQGNEVKISYDNEEVLSIEETEFDQTRKLISIEKCNR